MKSELHMSHLTSPGMGHIKNQFTRESRKTFFSLKNNIIGSFTSATKTFECVPDNFLTNE